jgi:hypothetical protein
MQFDTAERGEETHGRAWIAAIDKNVLGGVFRHTKSRDGDAFNLHETRSGVRHCP